MAILSLSLLILIFSHFYSTRAQTALQYQTVCEGHLLDISCGRTFLIYVKEAFYGERLRSNYRNTCSLDSNVGNNLITNQVSSQCDIDKTSIVRNICSGRHRCAFTPSQATVLFGPPARGCRYAKLDIAYSCVAFKDVYRGCSGDLNEADGYKYVMNQNYPTRSPFASSSSPCTYNIQVPEDRYIQIEYLDFDFFDGPGNTCTNNYLTIYVYGGDDSATPWVQDGVLCGTQVPPSKIYQSNIISIQFHSTRTSNANTRGFWIRYTGVTKDTTIPQPIVDTTDPSVSRGSVPFLLLAIIIPIVVILLLVLLILLLVMCARRRKRKEEEDSDKSPIASPHHPYATEKTPGKGKGQKNHSDIVGIYVGTGDPSGPTAPDDDDHSFITNRMSFTGSENSEDRAPPHPGTDPHQKRPYITDPNVRVISINNQHSQATLPLSTLYPRPHNVDTQKLQKQHKVSPKLEEESLRQARRIHDSGNSDASRESNRSSTDVEGRKKANISTIPDDKQSRNYPGKAIYARIQQKLKSEKPLKSEPPPPPSAAPKDVNYHYTDVLIISPNKQFQRQQPQTQAYPAPPHEMLFQDDGYDSAEQRTPIKSSTVTSTTRLLMPVEKDIEVPIVPQTAERPKFQAKPDTKPGDKSDYWYGEANPVDSKKCLRTNSASSYGSAVVMRDNEVNEWEA